MVITIFQDLSRWMRFDLPFIGEIRFNPIVTFLSLIVIWAFVIWCSIAKEDVPFDAWTSWIVGNFTWFYVGSTQAWIAVGIILYCRYVPQQIRVIRNLKLSFYIK